MRSGVEILKLAGFERIGRVVLSSDEICFAIQSWPLASSTLYAFTRLEDVLYVGKTSKSLQQRLRGYQHPGPSQSTNIRVASELSAAIKRGDEICVYALTNWEPVSFRGLLVDIPAGIEQAVIFATHASWNVAR
jgi:hypothetical protein